MKTTVFSVLDSLMMTVAFIGYVFYFIKTLRTYDVVEKIDNGVRSILLCIMLGYYLLK